MIVFDRSDDALAFIDKIETVYPKIKYGGGFEILWSGARNKDLVLLIPPPCGYSIPFIRNSSGLGQALACIRPLQKSLDVSGKDKESVSDVLQDGFMDEPITKKAKVDKSAKEGKPCNINLTSCLVLFKM